MLGEPTPPFPNRCATYALLEQVSYQGLLNNDPTEATKLFNAASTIGFFYLNLQDSQSGQELLSLFQEATKLSVDFFELPHDVKVRDSVIVDGKLQYHFGYKPIGVVPVQRGRAKDCSEHYYVGCRDIQNLGPPSSRTYNELIRNSFSSLLLNLSTQGLQICHRMLHLLSSNLGIVDAGPDYLPVLHPVTTDSTTHIRFMRTYPALESGITTVPAHTDQGTLTLLFNLLGGLQVYAPGDMPGVNGPVRESGWHWVQPLSGHLSVILGDALSTFSNGILRSARHRVCSPLGDDGLEIRHGVGYFLRPPDCVTMQSLKGESIPTSNDEEPITSFQDFLKERQSGRRMGTELHNSASVNLV